MSNRFKHPSYRRFMLTTLVMDPSVRESLRQMFRMGASDIRPDYMLIRKTNGTSPESFHASQYDRMDDPGAWYGTLPNGLRVGMIRHEDGTWFLNEV